MSGDSRDPEAIRREFFQALTTEHFALQGARSNTISESASRASLYLGTVSSAVVALALVGQVSHLGTAFLVFAVAIILALFFLGVVTYFRLLQTGSEDQIYARAIGRIRTLYAQIDPSRADFFLATSMEQEGLRAVGLWTRRWQQFIASAAMVAMVDAVVGGVFIAILLGELLAPPLWVTTLIGAVATLGIAVAFLVHQWRAWNRISAAFAALD